MTVAGNRVSAPRDRTPRLSWWRPGVGCVGLGFLALALKPFVQADDWLLPGVVILANGAILMPSVLRALHGSAEEILTDHFLLLVIAFVAYFVGGALLIPFGPRDQAEHALSYYWVDAPLGMRVTAVNCVGIGLALISGSLVGRRRVLTLARTVVRFGRFVPQWGVMLGFLIVGGASSVYVLSFDSGGRPGEVAPGIARFLAYLLLVVILVAAAHRGRWSLSLAIVLTAFEALKGLLLLTKAGVLMPLMALIAGLTLRWGVRRVMLPGLAVLLGAFVLIGNPMMTARNVYGLEDWVKVDWRERLGFLPGAVARATNVVAEGSYKPWSRFCYIPAQGAALDFYDAGDGGGDYRLLGWAFMPRSLFPGKPILTASSAEFHTKISGRVGSSTGQGVFVDGYYNLGWAGVVLVGAAVGCILSWTSVFAVEAIRSRALLWSPLALLGNYMAFRIDGSFLVDYWVLFVFFTYAGLAGFSAQKVLKLACRAQ